MENYIPISYLNDYIFCPKSIYNHSLYAGFDELVYQDKPQIKGKSHHSAIDNKQYSDRVEIYQNYEIVSTRYGLYGKIDIYNARTHELSERKSEIKMIYDGYIFQLYAQYFGLKEMGFQVDSISLYDYSKNKKYSVDFPENNPQMHQKFELTVEEIKKFSLLKGNFRANKNKCAKCIYNNLCDSFLC